MDLYSKNAVNVLIPKKYLIRYVLVYDVLPVELCYEINGKNFFDVEILWNLISQGKFNDDDVILKFKEESCTPYVALSELLSLGFISQANLDKFKDKSYDNYDVDMLSCEIIKTPENVVKHNVDISPPPKIDKNTFSKKMAFGDAVANLVYNQLREGCLPPINAALLHTVDTIKSLLGLEMFEPAKREIAVKFFKLCVKYNIDQGWPTNEIIDTIESELGTEIEHHPDHKNKLSALRKLLSNENRNIPFSDDGDILFRAMTLVLLNPEPHNLQAIKSSIGPNVYRLAEKFVLARQGYSYLTAEERAQIGKERTFLQKLNASFCNHLDEQFVPQQGLTLEHITDTNGCNNGLEQLPCLSFREENDLGKIFIINGIQPYAGYSLDLVYDEAKGLLLRIIDARSKYKMSKYKPKFAQEVLDIQKELPNNSRFEKFEHGLYLTLPTLELKTEDLKDKLADIFTILRPLGLEKKKSAIANIC